MKNYTGFYELAKSSSITESLGITEERENQLQKILREAARESNLVTESMQEIWENCDHPNEFAYCIFHYGTIMGVSKVLEGKLPDCL